MRISCSLPACDIGNSFSALSRVIRVDILEHQLCVDQSQTTLRIYQDDTPRLFKSILGTGLDDMAVVIMVIIGEQSAGWTVMTLTALTSRRAFDGELHGSWRLCSRERSPFSIAGFMSSLFIHCRHPMAGFLSHIERSSTCDDSQCNTIVFQPHSFLRPMAMLASFHTSKISMSMICLFRARILRSFKFHLLFPPCVLRTETDSERL